MMIMIVLSLRTKPSGLYRHRRRLGFTQSRLQRRKSNIRIAKLDFHAKERPLRTWDEVLSLVSSRSHSPDDVYSPAVRIPPNPGPPQQGRRPPAHPAAPHKKKIQEEHRAIWGLWLGPTKYGLCLITTNGRVQTRLWAYRGSN